MSIPPFQSFLTHIDQAPLPLIPGILLISALVAGILASLGGYGVISLSTTGCWICAACGGLMALGALGVVLLKKCRTTSLSQSTELLTETEPKSPSFQLLAFLQQHGIIQENEGRTACNTDGDLITYSEIDQIYPPIHFHPSLSFVKTSFNPERDRYENMLPYQHTRYQMQHTDYRTQCPYINASMLPDGHILTQGPKPSTFNDFWLMVWDSGLDTIVMTTLLVENSKRKCDQYWPDVKNSQVYGSLTVTCTSDDNGTREFKISDGTLTKKVTQHYLQWEDNQAFPVEELHKTIEQTKEPAIIHCSAGIGRTGTFAACLWIYKIFQNAKGWRIHLPKLVAFMRTFRASLVFTSAQYNMLKRYLEFLNSNSSKTS